MGTWINKTTDQAHEIAANSSFQNIEVPVGTWKAIVDSIIEKKNGEDIYDKYKGERKYLMKFQVIEGPGEGGTFLQNLFVLPENSEEHVNSTMRFLSKLSKAIGYDGPISEEAFVGKVLKIDVIPKKKGNGNTFMIHEPKKEEQKAAPSTPPVQAEGQTGGETVVSDGIPF